MTTKKSLIYTRTGDDGTTSLVGGTRVPKDSARLEAYGTVDELNSHIGLLAAHPDTPQALTTTLLAAQHRLFDIGSYLACDPQAGPALPHGIDRTCLADIEHDIDTLDSTLPPIRSFILPGGSMPAALAHVARTVCRRAERRILTLAATAPVDPMVTAYINRLSDYLFIAARHANTALGIPETTWQKQ